MHWIIKTSLLTATAALASCAHVEGSSSNASTERLIIDTHQDVPSLIALGQYDFGQGEHGRPMDTDLPKLRAGGVNAVFFSLWTPGQKNWAEMNHRAWRTEQLSRCQILRYPDRVTLAQTSKDVRRIAQSGRLAVIYGLEGGHALINSVDELRKFRAAGVRYVSLTHDRTTDWADADLDKPRWGGLNDLGRRMILEMNRIGIIPDLTHSSDETFFDTVAVSRGPVLLSHHGVRAVVDNPMNASDAMLDALKRNGGVISIIFYASQLNPAFTSEVLHEAQARVNRLHGGDMSELWNQLSAVARERELPPPSIEDVANQIDYVAKRIGIDHIGIGSDYAGGGGLPGLEDIGKLPRLIETLQRRGYTERDLNKILGGNILRIMGEAERLADAQAMRQLPPAPKGCPAEK